MRTSLVGPIAGSVLMLSLVAVVVVLVVPKPSYSTSCVLYDNVAWSTSSFSSKDGCSLQSLSNSVDFLGRFSDIDTVPIADWSSSGIRFAATASAEGSASIEVQFAPCGSGCTFFVDVSIDCASVLVFNNTNSHNLMEITLPNTVPGRLYDVSIRKITEAVYGAPVSTMGFSSLRVSGGLEISKASAYESLVGHCNDNTTVASTVRSMMFFGDSITAGYGVLANDPCPFSLATESSLAAYGALTAKAFGAANTFHTIAWSGQGMVRNYADKNTVSEKPMPYYYNRTLAGKGWDTASDKYWSPSQFPVDVFVVALGTNDYSVDPVPSDEEFINGYVSFLHLVRQDYPSALIATLCQPMNRGVQCNNTQTATELADVSAHYIKMPESLVTGDGCQGHPDLPSNVNMAEYLTAELTKLL